MPRSCPKKKLASEGASTHESDAANFGSALNDMNEMLDAGLEVVELLDADRPDAAGAVYRDRSVPLWKSVRASVYTLVDTAERIVSKAARGR
jgi:hypothetical protein